MLSCTMWFQSSVVLGLTDVWSAIRNATVSRLSHVIEHFSLSDLEMFFSELCDVRKSDKISHLSYRSFVDPQSAVTHSQLLASRYGTTCQLVSQLCCYSPSSDSALRHFCSCAHTLTLSLNL